MAKIDEKVMAAVSKLQAALASPEAKANKKSYEATLRTLERIKRLYKIK